MPEILQKIIFQNTVFDYLLCLIIFICSFAVIIGFKKIILIKIERWVKNTKTTVDDFIVRLFKKNLLLLIYFGAFYLSVQHLTLSLFLHRAINIVGVSIITIIGIRFLLAVINYAIFSIWLKGEENQSRERSIKGIISVLRIFIWGAGSVFLLDNFGFKVSAVIAGLGIGGIAVALAAQTVLGDLFSFFAILFDRPFEVGDFIIIGDFLGAVEYIGIKTTRIRSLGGEQLIFSNTDLTNSRVRNYKRMQQRRVVFKLGVTYQSTYQQVSEIPGIIKNIIEGIKDTRFDRAHFSSYGDFSLMIEVVYYVLSSDYNKYMDIQQEINLAIMRDFEKRKIEFAYPTQTLYVNNF